MVGSGTEADEREDPGTPTRSTIPDNWPASSPRQDTDN
jgi:hypothetical protein